MSDVPLIAVVGDPDLYNAIIESPDLSGLDNHLASVDDLLALNGDDLDVLDAVVVGPLAWRSATTPAGLRFLCDCPVIVTEGNAISLANIRDVLGVKSTDDPLSISTSFTGGSPVLPVAKNPSDMDMDDPEVACDEDPNPQPPDVITAPPEYPPSQDETTPQPHSDIPVATALVEGTDDNDSWLMMGEDETVPIETPLASLPHFPTRKGECLTIASWSSKGGVGKTAMAVNLAGAITRMTDLSVCVVDLDVEDPNVGSRLNVFKPTVTELLDMTTLTPDTIRSMLAIDDLTNIYAVLGPRQGIGDAAMHRLSPGNYDRIHRVLTQMFDVVVLDCPLGLNAPLAGDFALQRAGIVMAVTDTERSTVKGLSKALREVFEHRHYPREAVGLVINQQVGKKNAMPRGEMLDMLHRLPVLAEIMDDRDAFVGSANKGSLLVNRFGPEGDTMRKKFAEILRHILPDVELTEDRPMATNKAGKWLPSIFRGAK